MDFNFSLVSEIEALATLGVEKNDSEALSERLEDLVFPIRDYFLRNPVIIPLYKSRINKLLNIHTAAFSLQLLPTSKTFEILKSQVSSLKFQAGTADSNIELFRTIEEHRSGFRLKIAQTMIPAEIAYLALELCELEQAYMLEFLRLNTLLEASTNQVKASEFPDFGELIFELKSQSNPSLEMLAKEKARILLIRERNQ